jgi:hypothetical protein
MSNNTLVQEVDAPTRKRWYKRWWGISLIVVALIGVGSNLGGGSDTETVQDTYEQIGDGLNDGTETPAPATEAPSGLTVSEENAIRSAESYLETMAFSHSGLVNQLEYEGFTTEEATLAADTVTVDWNEQAAKSAESYLETMPFSRTELINQLEYEGFTTAQATYGVDQTGL